MLAVPFANSGYTILWGGKDYCRNVIAIQSLCKSFPNLFVAVAAVDAALVGVMLAFGIMVGLLVADRWLGRWHALSAVRGIGEEVLSP